MGLRCCANYLAGFMQICSEITKGSRKCRTPSFVLSNEQPPASTSAFATLNARCKLVSIRKQTSASAFAAHPDVLLLRFRRARNVLDGLNGKHNGQDKQQNS